MSATGRPARVLTCRAVSLAEALARFRGARPMPWWPPTWTGSPGRSSQLTASRDRSSKITA